MLPLQLVRILQMVIVVGSNSIANTANDTNIVSLNPTQSSIPPLRKSQKQSKPLSYL